ncbi:MAG TPA: thioesterase family protein [Bacteroidales bacterium]|nr:thioesterase family protein [Bacteroidales bacterium]HQQ12526.1 thioesterase family protein [Bacteroidales bacterium]
METTITKGIKGEHHLMVTDENTATRYGSGLVDVFATPAMIALMEQTSLQSIAWLLPHDKTSVGTEVCVKHLRATPVGHKLRCESRVTEVQGRKVIFEVSVWDDQILVGHGSHTRMVVDKEKFMAQSKL